MRLTFCVFLVFFVNLLLQAEVSFDSLAVNAASQAVFKATVSEKGTGTVHSWFRASLIDKTLETLTFEPQNVAWLPKLEILQVSNKFGVFRLNLNSTEGVTTISLGAFEHQIPLQKGKLLPMAYSPDGNYGLYFNKISATSGDLILYDVVHSSSTLVSKDLFLSYKNVPVSWSPFSQFFVYEKQGQLYYYSIAQRTENRVPEESLRYLGAGLLSSLVWDGNGDLVYLKDDVIYQILAQEFFNRSLYASQLQPWGVLGKLPFCFNPAEDQFWLSPDKKTLFFNLKNRNLFIYPREYLKSQGEFNSTFLNYLPLPSNFRVKKLLWDDANRITLLFSVLEKGKLISHVLRITPGTVSLVDLGEDVIDLVFSPDKSKVLCLKNAGVQILDASTLQILQSYNSEQINAGFWKDSNTLIICGEKKSVLWKLKEDLISVLFLGNVDALGFDKTGTPVALLGKESYAYTGRGLWILQNTFVVPEVSDTANDKYRIFTEPLASGFYKNWIQIRNLQAVKTEALLPKPETSGGNSSDSNMKIALAIDAMDTSEGLNSILETLTSWDLKASFFVNGDFLRRNPESAVELASFDQELGNLFYINYNLTDKTYVIDKDFIKKGLARQEDDWYKTTKKELSLLWHAPGWVSSSLLTSSAKELNYITVGKEINYKIGSDNTVNSKDLILQLIKDAKPGVIIPLSLGLKDSQTGQSFYENLDLLLNSLIESGYKIVTVSNLPDNLKNK